MSANTINVTKGAREENKVLDETVIYIPRKVVEEGKAIDSDWRDDVEETAKEIDEKTGLSALETYDDEQNYRSHEVISRNAENRIEIFRKRSENRLVGKKVLALAFGKAA